MHSTGIWLIGVLLLLVAFFPGFLYLFFKWVILEKKSTGVVNELRLSKAFEIESVNALIGDEIGLRTRIAERYGFARFVWPLGFLTISHLIAFSIIWGILAGCAGEGDGMDPLFHKDFLKIATLPMVAYMGATVFSYGHMLRRLYVWDLTPQVFWSALYRTWLVLALASVTFATFAGDSKVLSVKNAYLPFFGIGLVITELIGVVIARTRKYFHIKRLEVQELPLSLIHGINFWHEYRLEEEGVENVQNLATCDIIELTISTRYNLRTLIDWVDQSILIHRMGVKALKLREDGFICGAIDMAWASPAYSMSVSNSDKAINHNEMADLIAKTLSVEPVYVRSLMNGLLQENQIQVLWSLWQSRLDAYKTGGQAEV